MMSERDYIYYDYILKKIKPKKIKWKIYCLIRKAITIKESPSAVMIYLSGETGKHLQCNEK